MIRSMNVREDDTHHVKEAILSRRKQSRVSGKAIAAQRLRETTECECGSTKPAIVTKSVIDKGRLKVVGYCPDCIRRMR